MKPRMVRMGTDKKIRAIRVIRGQKLPPATQRALAAERKRLWLSSGDDLFDQTEADEGDSFS